MSEFLSYEGYTLVFEDDFNGETLDRTKWNIELHDPGWVNEELQAYVDAEDVLSLRDGCLHIRPTRLALGDGSVLYRPDGFPPRESTSLPMGFSRPA